MGLLAVLPRRLGFALAAAAAVGLAATTASAQAIEGIPFVIDGDTLGFGEIQVRLYGIDAPEAEQTCPLLGGEAPIGAWAMQTLRRLIGRDTVICHPLSRPAQGHVAAKCRTMAVADLGRAMVMAGFAWDFKRQGRGDGIYADDEAAARSQRFGVWAGEDECQPPWEWRRH